MSKMFLVYIIVSSAEGYNIAPNYQLFSSVDTFKI